MNNLKERIDKSYETYHRPPHQFENMVHEQLLLNQIEIMKVLYQIINKEDAK